MATPCYHAFSLVHVTPSSYNGLVPSYAGSPGGKPMRRQAHLVLSSGGVRATSYVGAVRFLEEEGFEWATISACSSGTLIGALLATGMSARDLERKVLETDLRGLSGPRPVLGFLTRWFSWPFARYSRSGVPRFFRYP